MKEIRVLLVDDHAELRAHLRQHISSQPDLHLVAEAGSAREAVHLAMQEALMVVVMDLSLPDGDGISATAEILQQRPALRVLGLTRHEEYGYLERMLAAGARGYVLKQHVSTELLAAIRTVAAGGTYIDPAFALKQPEQPPTGNASERETVYTPVTTLGKLTTEEETVLKRVAAGFSNNEIAQQLDMIASAVAEHKTRAMQKLSLRTRIDVIGYADEHGWRRK